MLEIPSTSSRKLHLSFLVPVLHQIARPGARTVHPIEMLVRHFGRLFSSKIQAIEDLSEVMVTSFLDRKKSSLLRSWSLFHLFSGQGEGFEKPFNRWWFQSMSKWEAQRLITKKTLDHVNHATGVNILKQTKWWFSSGKNDVAFIQQKVLSGCCLKSSWAAVSKSWMSFK